MYDRHKWRCTLVWWGVTWPVASEEMFTFIQALLALSRVPQFRCLRLSEEACGAPPKDKRWRRRSWDARHFEESYFERREHLSTRPRQKDPEDRRSSESDLRKFFMWTVCMPHMHRSKFWWGVTCMWQHERFLAPSTVAIRETDSRGVRNDIRWRKIFVVGKVCDSLRRFQTYCSMYCHWEITMRVERQIAHQCRVERVRSAFRLIFERERISTSSRDLVRDSERETSAHRPEKYQRTELLWQHALPFLRSNMGKVCYQEKITDFKMHQLGFLWLAVCDSLNDFNILFNVLPLRITIVRLKSETNSSSVQVEVRSAFN